MVREADEQFDRVVRRGGDCTVLIQGFRQMGKTSLLARGLDTCRRDGFLVAYTDIQAFSAVDVETEDRFYFALGESLASQLEPEIDLATQWSSMRGGGANLERYARSVLIRNPDTRLLWALDELDRLFSLPFQSDVFGLFRSWHNRHATEPSGPLTRLAVAISYSTEPKTFSDQKPIPVSVQRRHGDPFPRLHASRNKLAESGVW